VFGPEAVSYKNLNASPPRTARNKFENQVRFWARVRVVGVKRKICNELMK